MWFTKAFSHQTSEIIPQVCVIKALAFAIILQDKKSYKHKERQMHHIKWCNYNMSLSF